MKKTIQLFMFLAVLGLTITSCGKDDELDCNNLSAVLVGTWEAELLGPGTFEFQTDGTLIDQSNLLVDDEFEGASLDTKTWIATGNTGLTLRASDGSQNLDAVLVVDSIECDVIKVSQGTTVVTFRRT